jgi:hypothetical protein
MVISFPKHRKEIREFFASAYDKSGAMLGSEMPFEILL